MTLLTAPPKPHPADPNRPWPGLSPYPGVWAMATDDMPVPTSPAPPPPPTPRPGISLRIGHAPRLPRRPLRFRLLYAVCVLAAFASAFLAGSWAWSHAGATAGLVVVLGIAWFALRGRTPEVPTWRDGDLHPPKQASPSVPSGTVLAVDSGPPSGELSVSSPRTT